MACSSYVTDVNSINSALRIDATTTPSLELEHIPLTQHRTLLHSRNDGHSHSSDSDSPIFQSNHCKMLTPSLDIVMKKEHNDYDLEVTCRTVQTDSRGVDKTNDNNSSLPQFPTLSDVPTAIKVEDSGIDNGGKTSLQSDFPAPEVKHEISEDIIDDLDHIVLKERQKMLLARKLPGLSNQAVEDELLLCYAKDQSGS